MKKLISILFGFLISTNIQASAPSPQIFVVDDSGKLISAPGSMGVAPYQIHVSAFPDLPQAQCWWDPTQWETDGEHNLCQDVGHVSQKNLPATAAAKYFNTDKTKLTHPQNVEGGSPSACFETYGNVLDAASIQLITDLAQCLRQRDLILDAANSTSYLGGSSALKVTYAWDFGDVGSAYNQVPGWNAAHVYSKPGSYVLTLKITNEQGVSGTSQYTVNAQPDNRVQVQINSDADLPKLNVTAGSPQGRHLIFKSATTFHMPTSLNLFTNDWASSSDVAPANLLLGNFNAFTPHNSSHVLVENLNVTGSGGGWVATGYGNNHTFRNIAFQKTHGGFNPGNSGVLIQNCGMPHAADGSWQSNHIQSNWIIHSVKGLALYGNHAYLLKSDGNAEPAIRSNSGNLITMYDNEIGGYTGKNDQVSVRGAKNVYFSKNQMRGGVFNIQFGTSPDPQPGALADNLVIENSTLENLGFETSQSVPNIEIRNNLFHIHGDADASYNALYPRPNPHPITINGGVMSFTQIPTQNVTIENNALQLDESQGTSVVFYGSPQNFQFLGNRVLSPLVPALRFNGSLNGVTLVKNNSYYLNTGIQIADLGLKSDTLAHWNANILASGNQINDSVLDVPAKAPMSNGELAVPTPPPAPKSIAMNCESWNYVEKICPIVEIKVVTSLTMNRIDWCIATDPHKPGFKLTTQNGLPAIDVFGGCRGGFSVIGN